MKRRLKKYLVSTFMFSSLFVLGYSIANAATGSQYLWIGGFPASEVKAIGYVMSGGTSSYQKNIMKAGVESWNGISTKVRVLYDNEDAKISVYKSSSSVSGLNGRMDPYYENALGRLKFDENFDNVWEVADIFGFDNNMDKLKLTDDEKKAIYIHEMGHALSLKHNDSTYYLIMNTDTLDTAAATTLKSDDKGNLKLKWGK